MYNPQVKNHTLLATRWWKHRLTEYLRWHLDLLPLKQGLSHTHCVSIPLFLPLRNPISLPPPDPCMSEQVSPVTQHPDSWQTAATTVSEDETDWHCKCIWLHVCLASSILKPDLAGSSESSLFSFQWTKSQPQMTFGPCDKTTNCNVNNENIICIRSPLLMKCTGLSTGVSQPMLANSVWLK